MRHEKVNDLFRPLMNGLNPAILTDVYQDRINELEKEKKHLVNENKRLKIMIQDFLDGTENTREEISLELNKTLIELDKEFIICPGCAGAGDVRETAKSTDLDEIYVKCVECLGNGKVQK